MTVLVRFDHVSVRLGSRDILRDCNFELVEGEKAVIRGRSGAGKSTVLKTLLGLHAPIEGQLFFEGRPLTRSNLEDIRARTAYIGQEPILGAATVREALLLPFTYKVHRAMKPTEATLHKTLASLGLASSLLGQPCSRVSGGEKQRIAIARAQLLGQRLYLLDEITSALDEISKTAVLNFFSSPGLTVFSASHDPAWIARCSTVLELADGHLTRVP